MSGVFFFQTKKKVILERCKAAHKALQANYITNGTRCVCVWGRVGAKGGGGEEGGGICVWLSVRGSLHSYKGVNMLKKGGISALWVKADL